MKNVNLKVPPWQSLTFQGPLTSLIIVQSKTRRQCFKSDNVYKHFEQDYNRV